MSWRAPRSSTAVGVRNEKNPSTTSQSRTKTALSKNRQEDKGTRRELFIGWEGKDAYLQLEPLTIEVWGKRSSKPKTVPNTTKETKKDDVTIHQKDVYFCWTYTKCDTVEDYDEFVANSLGSRFKPHEESNQPIEDDYKSPEGYQWKVSRLYNVQETIDDSITQFTDFSCNENSEQLNTDNNPRAILDKNVTIDTRQQSDTNSPLNRSAHDNVPTLIDVKSNSAFKSDSVSNLTDSRLRSISQSSPNLRVLDKIEGKRKVSSAKSRRRHQNGAHDDKDDVGIISTKPVNESKQDGSSIQSDTNDVKESEQTSSKNALYSNSNSESVLRTCAQILETLQLSSPDRQDIGFDLPQATHVSLGDLLSSTPRLQRRLGTAKGRDPTVYAALHGNSPPPRPISPDLKPKQSPRPPTPDIKVKQNQRQVTPDSKTKLNPIKSGNKPDLIKDHTRGSGSPQQDRELPPVKAPNSPRTIPRTQSSPNDLPKTPPKEYSLRTDKSANTNGGKRTMALLTYHKSSDTDGLLCSSSPDVVSPDGSPRMSENGDALRNNKANTLFFLQGTSAGLHQYSGPTRGPPGFRPQGQKTPLHRAMENAHKKLYGQHYHLFSSQTNYGNTQQERQHSARSVPHRVPSARGQDPSYSNSPPNQAEHTLKQTRSTTAPTRRMYHGTTSALKATNRRPSHNSEQIHNSTHNRKMSAPILGENTNGSRRYSYLHDNLDKVPVTLRGRPMQR